MGLATVCLLGNSACVVASFAEAGPGSATPAAMPNGFFPSGARRVLRLGMHDCGNAARGEVRSDCRRGIACMPASYRSAAGTPSSVRQTGLRTVSRQEERMINQFLTKELLVFITRIIKGFTSQVMKENTDFRNRPTVSQTAADVHRPCHGHRAYPGRLFIQRSGSQRGFECSGTGVHAIRKTS